MKKEIKMLKTHVLSIDAWRDNDDWQWNAWYTVEKDVYINADISNRALIKFARDNMGLLSNESKGRIGVDDDGYNIVLINRNTREPLFAFCYGEYWEENGLWGVKFNIKNGIADCDFVDCQEEGGQSFLYGFYCIR